MILLLVKCLASEKIINMKKYIFNNLFVLLFILMLTAFNPFLIIAQEGKQTKVISGTVTDDSGLPVAGTVLYNSIEEIVTDKNGNFSITIPVTTDDQIVINEKGYQTKVINIYDGVFTDNNIVLLKNRTIDENRIVSMPFQNIESYRSVSASNIIYGEELSSYPTTTVLEALSGRIPGMSVNVVSSQPGFEAVNVTIRGRSALVYIDGIMRDAADLVVDEIEKVEVFKDLSGRSVYGITAGNPIISITTKSGKTHKTAIKANVQLGFRNPTVLPDYLDAYDYSLLFNEARVNDGRDPLYSNERLEGYKSGVNPLRYPNVDYYDKFVKTSTPFRSVNVNASGGNDRVKYFSLMDYVGTGGLEAIGQESVLDRFKIRANIDLKFNDVISMNANLSGTYGESKYPNDGGGANVYNMFNQVLSRYPSNAHALEYDSMLFVSDNYPQNLINELKYGGFAKRIDLNTQNSTSLKLDFDRYIEGLSVIGKVAFDVNNSITDNMGGSEALYRHTIVGGQDQFQRIREKEVVTSLVTGADFFLRRTTLNGIVNYERSFGKHELNLNGIYAQMLEEVKVQTSSYQPRKTQDMSFRANYAYDKKYVLQAELNYSGMMKLPPGNRFNLFSTAGAGWVISNEDVFKNNESIDYLKLYTTYGVMGIDNFYIAGYDQFYLHQTVWRNIGSWRPGIEGNFADYVNIYEVVQQASTDYKIPKRGHFNVGLEGLLFNKSLNASFNYFSVKDYDLISRMESRVPSLFGTGGFLPATNFGEEQRWGIDGALQYTKKIGEVDLSFGANASYFRGKYIEVDEPMALDEHRKLAGKDIDLIWGYETDGLFQTEADVNDYNNTTSWGDIQTGDIRYVDYNKDGTIDAKDVHPLSAHYPRINYGLNFSVGYKGFRLLVVGKGVADGKTMLTNSRYFWINNENQNFSAPMLDRWPNTNNYPRLTTSSPHNYQGSSFWLRDASYFSLSNVELSYTLPRNSSLNMYMKETKFFVRGANLVHLSGLSSLGLNPEDVNAGIQNYPHMRTITFGFSAKF